MKFILAYLILANYKFILAYLILANYKYPIKYGGLKQRIHHHHLRFTECNLLSPLYGYGV
jgi:hypothetical protein